MPILLLFLSFAHFYDSDSFIFCQHLKAICERDFLRSLILCGRFSTLHVCFVLYFFFCRSFYRARASYRFVFAPHQPITETNDMNTHTHTHTEREKTMHSAVYTKRICSLFTFANFQLICLTATLTLLHIVYECLYFFVRSFSTQFSPPPPFRWATFRLLFEFALVSLAACLFFLSLSGSCHIVWEFVIHLRLTDLQVVFFFRKRVLWVHSETILLDAVKWPPPPTHFSHTHTPI